MRLADNSLLEILFSGEDGPPLDIALKLPVMLDWPLQQPIDRSSNRITNLKIEYEIQGKIFQKQKKNKGKRKLEVSGMKQAHISHHHHAS